MEVQVIIRSALEMISTKSIRMAAVVNELGEIKEEVKIENTKETLEQFAMKYQGANNRGDRQLQVHL